MCASISLYAACPAAIRREERAGHAERMPAPRLMANHDGALTADKTPPRLAISPAGHTRITGHRRHAARLAHDQRRDFTRFDFWRRATRHQQPRKYFGK